jgi:hypothetical protein
MNRDRTRAYRRVILALEEVGPSRLLADEQDRLRHAADTLVLTREPLDDEARAALTDAERLCRALVDSGRWEEAAAMRLADDVADCGPEAGGQLEAA